MIVIACVNCGQKIQVKDGSASNQGRCPKCGKAIAIPGPSLTNAASQSHSVGRVEATAALAPGTSLSDEEYGFLAVPEAEDEMGRLGGYRVLKVLGSGGMGVVFLAEDIQLQRRVALKAIKPGQGTAQAKQRFLREAQHTAKLKHDHVVTIYQVGEDRGVPFLAMEFLKGEPLDERLRREGKLPFLEAIRIAREAAEGLAAAHEVGLVHRDVKPGNLWLEAPKNRVKVLDFGLARGGTEDIQLTQSGAIVGTPAYMAPEQALGRKVDARADLFSIGCVLYRMVTGELPFQGPDTISTCLAVAHDDPMPPQERNPAVPPALAAFILRLLAKKPEDRPPSAAAVAEELASLERAREDTAMISAAALKAAGTSPRRRLIGLPFRLFFRLSWKLRILTGGVLLLLLTLFVLGVASGHRHDKHKGSAAVPPTNPSSTSDPLATQGRDKPFVLRRKAGGIQGEYKSLELALREVTEGDIIEVQSNGPFALNGIDHSGRSLIVKAAPGYRPRFDIKGQVKLQRGMLYWHGCDLWSDGGGKDVNFRVMQGDCLIRDCRIFVRSFSPVGFDFQGAKFTILDSLISCPERGNLVNLVFLGARSSFEMSNSIVSENTPPLNFLAFARPGGQRVQLRNNSFQVNALLVYPDSKKEYPEPVRVESEGNLHLFGGVFYDTPEEVKPLLNWTGKRNLYVSQGPSATARTGRTWPPGTGFWARTKKVPDT